MKKERRGGGDGRFIQIRRVDEKDENGGADGGKDKRENSSTTSARLNGLCLALVLGLFLQNLHSCPYLQRVSYLLSLIPT